MRGTAFSQTRTSRRYNEHPERPLFRPNRPGEPGRGSLDSGTIGHFQGKGVDE